MRRKVLDSLAVFYEEAMEDEQMIELMESGEKLIMVFSKWENLVQMFVRL